MNFKKILSVLLTVIVILSNFVGIPLTVNAETYGYYTYIIENGTYCRITAYSCV